MPRGRPTKYKPEYCEEIEKFFNVEPYYDKPIEHYGKDGEVKWEDFKRVANKLPTFKGFAQHIGVNTDTIVEWEKKYKDFSVAYTRAKEHQKYFLIENGLNGCYNPAFAIFVCKNITDMKDKQEVDHSGEFILKIEDYKRGNENANRDKSNPSAEAKVVPGSS